MNPGLWEVTVELAPLEGSGAMPPITQTFCFTRQDVESGGVGALSGGLGQASQCRPENLIIESDSASWTLNCEGMSGQGHLTYDGDSYRGSADLTIDLGGQSQTLRQTFSGRRLADCQK